MSIKNRLKILFFTIITIGGFFIAPNTVLAAGSLTVNSINAVKTYAETDNTYSNGMKWIFEITVPTDETVLNMKFTNWTTGVNSISVAGNTRIYSPQSLNASNQSSAITLVATDTYSSAMNLNPASDLDNSTEGRQIEVTVEFKIPTGSVDGSYSTTYGVQTNLPVMSGTVSITGTTKFGQQLTADISALTYTPETISNVPAYQWQRNGVDITGATAQSYTLVEADIGKVIRVAVGADNIHATGNVVISGATLTIQKANGASAPSAPTLSSKTSTSITLNANALREFSNDSGSTWQDSEVFTGLSVATEYTFIARIKETSTTNASTASGGINISTKDTFTLTYTAGDHGSITGSSPQTVDYGTDGTEVTAIPATGYHFDSWSDAIATADRTDTNIIANKSVTASFAINNYSVTFNENTGTTPADPTNKTADYNTNVGTLPTPPTKTGYTFASWNTQADGNGTAFTATTAVTDNITVYAKWNINNYTITFNENTGTSPADPTTKAADYNTNVGSLPSPPTKDGYSFVSWNTQADGNGTTFTATTVVTDNITVYAKWNANNNTITFDGNTNTGGTTADQTLATDTSANLRANGFNKTGYTFAGWATSAGGAVIYTDAASYTMGTSSVTLYAKWNINNYTVTFNENTGTTPANPTTKTADYNTNVGSLPTPPSKTGYAFAGWNTQADGNGTAFTATTAVTDNITVYAKWNAPLTTPTFSPNSGSVAFGVTAITINSDSGSTIYYTTNGSTPTTGSSSIASGSTITLSSVANPIKAFSVKTGYPDSPVGTSGTYTQAATANLTGLALSGSPSNYTFASGTYTYNGLIVLNAVSSITVTPTGAGTITVQGLTVTSGQASGAIALTAGTEKTITVIATETGKTAKTYTIKVIRNLVAIGQNYQGGKVAYVDSTGIHGLIAAAADQSAGIYWHANTSGVTGATSGAIGAGNANTNAIIALYGAESNAARICYDLSEGGYTDWYLPSLDELNQLYINRVAIGGFTTANYWSSTEYNNIPAYSYNQIFNDGSVNVYHKTSIYAVRAVRSF